MGVITLDKYVPLKETINKIKDDRFLSGNDF